MIIKDKFIEGIEKYKEGLDFLRNMDDNGLDFYDTPLATSADALLDVWLDNILNSDGVDLIYWWLFEEVDKIIYEDEKQVNVENIDDLYNYLKENNYFNA